MRHILALAVLLTLLGCGRDGRNAGTSPTQAQLDPAIRDAPSVLPKFVAKDWENPVLIIRPEGVEVQSKSLSRRTVEVGELAELLVSLPLADWRYGRVVAASRIGIRSGAPDEEKRIELNVKESEAILQKLGVRVNWLPSS